MLKTEIKGDELIITVHKDYIINSAEHGLTSGGESTVTDKDACFRHYAAIIEDGAGDSVFNHCLDVIASDAAEYFDWINRG